MYMNFNSRPVSVLLVDDDEINNFISIKLIKKALLNTEIMACLNGKFAIDQLVEIQRKDPDKMPDYILLDINMPIMNGWEFLDAYGKLPGRDKPKPVIIMLTTSANPADKIKAKNVYKTSGFETKPLTAKTLEAILRTFFAFG